GVVFPGVASEVDTLSADERAGLVARLGARLAGRRPFIVGASADEPGEVLQHIAAGRAAGAAAAMVMAPGALGADMAAQVAFFDKIAAESGLPLMAQNAPVPIGAGLAPPDIAQIAAVPGVAYVKEETMPCGQNLSRIRADAGQDILGVFGGAGGRYITDELARGSLGTLPASELADLHARLVRAWAAGDRAEARRLFMVSMPLLNFQAIFRMHMTKETLRRRGVITSTFVRGAGPRMDEDDLAELSALLDQVASELGLYPIEQRTAAQ
ncbi:MAG: dihydrodipicolinate synthase family protein, partial [Pseudomonadota bacterium]